MDMGNNDLIIIFFSIIHNRSFSDSQTLSHVCKKHHDERYQTTATVQHCSVELIGTGTQL